MKAIFYPRERVITEASTDYDLVVLEGVNEYYDTIGDNVALRRNPNLTAQLQAVKNWGVPILLRIVSNAQWYSDLVKSMTDEPGWTESMNKLTIDATSAMIGLSRSIGVPVHGLVITAWKDDLKGTTSAWVKETMRHLIDASKRFALLTWAEFPAMIDQSWDKGQLLVFRDNIENAEYAVRPTSRPTMTSAEITMPYNTMTYFPGVIDEPDPDLPGEDEYISALMCLPEILVELRRSNQLAESIYKLIEATAPWRQKSGYNFTNHDTEVVT